MDGKNLYVQIYEYMLARIHFAVYPKGEPLPPVPKLSKQFNVSTMVIRGSYRLLEENGYIAGHREKYVVVSDDAAAAKRDLPPNMLLSEEALEDVHRSFDLIFPSIYYAGLFMCKDADVKELYQILEEPVDAWFGPTMNFLAHITKALQNGLLLDLFYDIMFFCYPTYLSYLAGEPDQWGNTTIQGQNKLKPLLILKEEGNYAALWDIVKLSYPFNSGLVSDRLLINKSAYQWGKPQICLSTASKIVSIINNGDYPAGTYLPSARIMAEEFSMAVITMRRAIALLNDLGVLESVNGKGTRVISHKQGKKRVKWNDPTIKDNILLFLESLHIQAITCGLLSRALFRFITEEELIQLKEKVGLAKQNRNVGVANTACLQALIKAAKLPALKVVYDKLFSLLIWGQPLAYLQPELILDDCMDQLITSLDNHDVVLFSKTLEQSISATFTLAKSKAVSLGIEKAEELSLPYL